MKSISVLSATLCPVLFAIAALAQSGPAPVGPSPNAAAGHGTTQSGEPVSYASLSELNGILSQLEGTSKNTQADLAKLRIERWKTDGGTKRQTLGNVDSIQRNLQGALPEILAQLRSTPESVPATFKLYRNLDALYDVLGSVVEAAGAFGSKDDLQSLSNDLNSFEATRKQLGERIDNLATAKEADITRLRTELKTAQTQTPATPPKKIVVDDTEPPKKPVTKKKTTPKSTTSKPAGQTPSDQQSQPQSKPQ